MKFVYVLKLIKDYDYEGIEEEAIVASTEDADLESIKDSIETELKDKKSDFYFSKLYLTENQISSLNVSGNYIWLEIEPIKLI